MIKKLMLGVKIRQQVGKKVNKLRKQEQIPAILYGHKIKNLNVVVPYHTFEKIYSQAKSSSLVDLIIDKKQPVKVIIQEVQKDPKTDKYIHIDFYQVKMTEKIHVNIELRFINEAPAVKNLGGVLVANIEEIEVSCLPQHLVHEIEVDISKLETFDDIILVKDLIIPPEIEVLNNYDDAVVHVVPPRKETEEKPAEEEAKEEETDEALIDEQDKSPASQSTEEKTQS